MEKCANCGREIGNLETPHVFDDNVVCGRCIAILRPPPIEYARPVTPGSEPPSGVIAELRDEWGQIQRQRAKSRGTNWPLVILAICLSPCLLCAVFSALNPGKQSSTSTGTPSVSPVPAPTAARPTAPPPASVGMRPLGGLLTTSPGMVYENLRPRGYEITRDFQNEVWICKKEINMTRYLVEIYGTATRVHRINASVIVPRGEDVDAIAMDDLSFLASVQYDGADQDAAIDFVKSNLGRNAVKSIGGVKFDLRTPSQGGRLLYITNE